jgi:hypothetical protein
MNTRTRSPKDAVNCGCITRAKSTERLSPAKRSVNAGNYNTHKEGDLF